MSFCYSKRALVWRSWRCIRWWWFRRCIRSRWSRCLWCCR